MAQGGPVNRSLFPMFSAHRDGLGLAPGKGTACPPGPCLSLQRPRPVGPAATPAVPRSRRRPDGPGLFFFVGGQAPRHLALGQGASPPDTPLASAPSSIGRSVANRCVVSVPTLRPGSLAGQGASPPDTPSRL